jgi:TPR repeat protein
MGKVLPIAEEPQEDWYGALLLRQSECSALDDESRKVFNRGFDAAAAGYFKDAFRIYRDLAREGCAISQYYVGVMYLKGAGTLQDFCQAHMWLNIAASQGHRKASRKLDYLTARMSVDQLAEAQKLAREWLSEHQEA